MEVKGGVINIDIGYLGMHIFSEVKNLCEKTQCPIPANQELELTYVEKLPSFIPPVRCLPSQLLLCNGPPLSSRLPLGTELLPDSTA